MNAAGVDDAGALIAVKAVTDALTGVQRELRGRVQDGMRPGDRRVAYATVAGEEVEIGQVTMTKPKTTPARPTAKVVDQEALTEWCKKVYPDSIRVEEYVSAHVVADLLRAAEAGTGEFPDPATGEMLPCPPGVVLDARPSESRPTLQVRLAAAARDYAAGLLDGMVFTGALAGNDEVKEIGQ